MKLRNKKTGEIGNLAPRGCEDERLWVWIDNKSKPEYRYNSLAELNEEWEDYDEPKEYWYIADNGEIEKDTDDWDDYEERMKEIGNYFETKEEAEKAVGKLKAWKRLKDGGFRFSHIRSIDGVSIKHKDLDQYTIIAYADENGCDQEDLDTCIGGEE